MDDCICGNLILTTEVKNEDYQQCSVCLHNYCNECTSSINECDCCDSKVCISCENECSKCGKTLCDKCTIVDVETMEHECIDCHREG